MWLQIGICPIVFQKPQATIAHQWWHFEFRNLTQCRIVIWLPLANDWFNQESFHNQFKIFWYGAWLKMRSILQSYLFWGPVKWQLITLSLLIIWGSAILVQQCWELYWNEMKIRIEKKIINDVEKKIILKTLCWANS